MSKKNKEKKVEKKVDKPKSKSEEKRIAIQKETKSKSGQSKVLSDKETDKLLKAGDKKSLIAVIKKADPKLKDTQDNIDKASKKLLEFAVPDIDRYKKRLKKSVLQNDLTYDELKLIIDNSPKYRARATYIREERIKNAKTRILLEGDSNKKYE